MKYFIKIALLLSLFCGSAATPLLAQGDDPACNEVLTGDLNFRLGPAVINYGSSIRMKKAGVGGKYSTTAIVGMTVVGEAGSPESDIATYAGYWGQLIGAPVAPTVVATQGELKDRIQISWAVDPLSSAASGGFNLYRDGVFTTQVSADATNYNDFNVIAGKPYVYTVRAVNDFGEGLAGSAVGFLIPNGVVTGWVQTINGSPVPDAVVALTPLQGFSAGFGTNAGAFAIADTLETGESTFLPAANGDWSMTFWIKTESATADAAILELEPYPFYIQAKESVGGNEGVAIALSAAGTPILSGDFPTATKNEWHHVTFTLDGSDNQGRLYIDGILVDRKNMGDLIPSAEILNIGERTDSPGNWNGKIDELRIYHRRLDELDLAEIQMGTASSVTPGLAYYWKMDEELGTKSFDIIRRNRLYFCGADFASDRPNVRTSGKTNSEGFYRIDGVSYGTGTTFLAKPMKDFYLHRALLFDRAEQDTVLLPDFTMPEKATLELWLNSAGPDGTQTVLSKKWPGGDFQILLKPNGPDNDVVLSLNNSETTLGTLGMSYQHLAFTIDNALGSIQGYKNGSVFGSAVSIPGSFGSWSDSLGNWVVGARDAGGYSDYYGGLIDEIAVYDSKLSPAEIQNHAQNSRDPQEEGLAVYFGMDEGSGNRLNNAGSKLLDPGMTHGTEWSPLAPNQETEPHVFSPSTRQVTLNPSVTSVDQVDFIDRSTVAVSGFVRYANTDCFANNVEILVNGEPYSPRIFTDSTGKFVIDFDPGTSAELTPVFENHQFEPASHFVINVVNPIAGLLFNNVTTRKISGQIFGGSQTTCRKSIISGPIEDCRVTVRTLDGCFEWEQLITATDGVYEFENLPPLEVTVAITKHNNPQIYNDFQTQGGKRIDLTQKDSMDVDFVYIASPNVEVSGFENYQSGCDYGGETNLIVIPQEAFVSLEVKVYEQYGPGQDPADRCYLDTAALIIDNAFDAAYDFIEPRMDSLKNANSQTFTYDFVADNPIFNPPHLQLMQITADVGGKKGTYIQRALITGIIKGPAKFTTTSPMFPNFILRDPPGDGSAAFIEKGRTYCSSISIENSGGAGPFFTLDEVKGIDGAFTLPFGGPVTKVQLLAGVTSELDARVVKTSRTSMEYCLTATERISTDDGDLIVGGSTSFDGGQTILAGNDVYVGTALNFVFSDSKDLRFFNSDDPDPTKQCSVTLDDISTIESDAFPTTYMYSEWNIENNVIRYLDSLILDVDVSTQAGVDMKDSLENSKQRWLDYIELNKDAKSKAAFTRNISWDAGVQYEYSETRDTSVHVDEDLNEKFEGHLGDFLKGEVDGGGSFEIELKIGSKFEGSFIQGNGADTTKTWTTGYTLKDDDPGDTWTMDVKDDPLFKSPVFDIVAGQTSCPWEVGTAQREGVSLISVDGNTRLNVPSNGKAAFNFLLNNNSQTGETFTYSLTAGPESNTKGAIIKLNGAPLDHNVYYAIPWGTQLPVTITVERGPEEYSYEGLEVVLFSECHDIRCNALGFAPDFDPILYSAVYLNVEFVEPCSEVDISQPLEGWVIKPDATNPATQDVLPITVSDYDLSDDDLVGIRIQYRPKNGDGAWINITGGSPDYIPKADLGPVFTTYNWDTGGTPKLADGEYEIRAVTVCTGGPDDHPGISHIISGKIDRQPPSLIGVPEPSDGVYNVGDEISFTFNKEINCSKLNAVDNVFLFDATTFMPIDIDITCYENKIIIDPNFQNEFFENRILRAELHDIEDKTGNTLVFEKWEFYVDRNELAWLTDSIGLTKYADETKAVTARIHNRGGYPVPFKLNDLPSWVHVVPDTGVLAANEIRDIRFEVDSNLAFGLWSDSINLHTVTGQNPFFMGGDERLPLGVRVVCRPPTWGFDPGLYESSMNMVLRLNIQGIISTDIEDMVVAYIGDELRGRANVQYVPQLDDYLAYLTIYGDAGDDNGESIRFEIWDASACMRFGDILEDFDFQSETIIGVANAPEVLHTNSLVLNEIPLGAGWNWISFNLEFPDDDIDEVLESLKYLKNNVSLIKDQSSLATWNGSKWHGPLKSLGNTSLYLYRSNQPDTLKILGDLINPLTFNIPVVSGWNWVSYIPNYALPIDDALGSLSAQTSDMIKGQAGFAQYVDGYGWLGNLKFLKPPNGYQIKLTNPGVLNYPAKPFTDNQSESRGGGEQPISSYWTVDPTQFEFGMTLIGALKANGENLTTGTMELGVFADNEVRGAAQAIYIEPIDGYLFFLNGYANSNGELLNFRLFDSETGDVLELPETMYFSSDQHQGTIDEPVPFSLPSTGTSVQDMLQSFEIQPNPFNTETTFRFVLPAAQDIALTITDVSGRVVSEVRTQAVAGLNVLTWNGVSNSGQHLNPGVYFVQLQTENGSVSKRVVLQR